MQEIIIMRKEFESYERKKNKYLIEIEFAMPMFKNINVNQNFLLVNFLLKKKLKYLFQN